jgi:hypothetical protein
MTRDAELANEKHVERGIERPSDLERDRDASTGQAQHYDIIAATVMTQLVGELSARVGSIPKPASIHSLAS